MHAIITPVIILAFIVVKPIDLFRFQTDRRFASHVLIRTGGLKGYMFLAVYYRGAQDTDSVDHPLCTCQRMHGRPEPQPR